MCVCYFVKENHEKRVNELFTVCNWIKTLEPQLTRCCSSRTINTSQRQVRVSSSCRKTCHSGSSGWMDSMFQRSPSFASILRVCDDQKKHRVLFLWTGCLWVQLTLRVDNVADTFLTIGCWSVGKWSSNGSNRTLAVWPEEEENEKKEGRDFRLRIEPWLYAPRNLLTYSD